MKLFKSVIQLTILILSGNLSAQDFSVLSEVRLDNSENCRKAQQKVIQCSNYLLSTPSNQEDLNSLYAIAFIIDWMGATPHYIFDLNQPFYEVIKSNHVVVGRYYATLASAAIENNIFEENVELQIRAITAFLEYCESSSNQVKITGELQKYIDAKNHKRLKKLIVGV